MKTLKIKLQGLHCPACVQLSTMKLKKIAGVETVKINLVSGQTEIIANRDVSIDEAKKMLQDTDYSISNI
ncbi:hypothetical protein COT94_03645 [Candidatus Falkowbacteria bacterium CG10_big_fil_rev_8_21_14_0_10_37_14]|uniref:HMA domain-containing protein n=1 Tax=Candidatus Falkowbacteria bacterium CG10_big_fil_rev_8_21_14_0_10_37_14 TaxID=1974561 RepID=A0A2M6WSP5_9BACT|nr:heavy-metal-associated domain-containing protein [Candidatus Falkowbacteria bacterium]PIT95827.1 MAG: hypothetical protein COT94_03645 [Candidatus Falkowbacteria bacterium CG10_big_fil_rev_8_21_14_0_10_37_14]